MAIKRIILFAVLAAIAPAALGLLAGLTRAATESFASAETLRFVLPAAVAFVEIGLFATLALIQDERRLEHVLTVLVLAVLLAGAGEIVLGFSFSALLSNTTIEAPPLEIHHLLPGVVRLAVRLVFFAMIGAGASYSLLKYRSRRREAS